MAICISWGLAQTVYSQALAGNPEIEHLHMLIILDLNVVMKCTVRAPSSSRHGGGWLPGP